MTPETPEQVAAELTKIREFYHPPTITRRVWPPRLMRPEVLRHADGTEYIKADIAITPEMPKARVRELGESPSLVHLTVTFDGVHLCVCRQDRRDGITWDELQAVKNIVIGSDVTCIEVFPPQAELVYQANVRHLWVVDDTAVPSLWKGTR